MGILQLPVHRRRRGFRLPARPARPVGGGPLGGKRPGPPLFPPRLPPLGALRLASPVVPDLPVTDDLCRRVVVFPTGTAPSTGPDLRHCGLHPFLLDECRMNSALPMNSADKPILVWGGGGHGHVVIDLLRTLGGWSIAGIVDSVNPPGSRIMDVPVLGDADRLPELRRQGIDHLVVAIGDCGPPRRHAGAGTRPRIPDPHPDPSLLHPLPIGGNRPRLRTVRLEHRRRPDPHRRRGHPQHPLRRGP
jgi:hypothetical protein